MAASEAGLNLKGTKFLVTGEPLTAQKKNEIEAAGASAISVYGISEAGVIAAGCNKPHAQSDHCHLYKDTTAVITHKTSVPQANMTVDALLFTSILYESPKLLLNVGMGDCGDLDSDGCTCGFEQVGFDVHLSNLCSYEKLTGEGVTFVGTDFVWIIEKLLPETFGGMSSDYQVIEEEDESSLTQVRLMISPRVGNVNETKVVSTFLRALKGAEARGWAQSGTEMWRQSNMLQIVRHDPVPTSSGKVMPFHLMK
jgi:phenylacetate-coenzyme A ligase PaaK-like adenylate-forming protein